MLLLVGANCDSIKLGQAPIDLENSDKFNYKLPKVGNGLTKSTEARSDVDFVGLCQHPGVKEIFPQKKWEKTYFVKYVYN